MNRIGRFLSLLLVAGLCAVSPWGTAAAADSMAMYGPAAGAVGATGSSADSELTVRQGEFKRFVPEKIAQLNRNLRHNRDKMDIIRIGDGRFRARFHQIDKSSVSSKVSRSQSKTSPFVAILSYQEKVFESYGASAEACRSADFAVVEILPNRHIFSYSKGAWQ
ncbi:MAG: hypothetical protein RQ723_06920 [Desulfuromonadales bacterium]|nr:hypothetical protein [Desulfuromonadales bacterium]